MIDLLAAVAPDNGNGWFDARVVTQIVATIGLIVVAIVTGRYAIKQARIAKSPSTPDEPTGVPPASLSDLVAAAGSRITALRTNGPARRERLEQSRTALETAAAALETAEEHADIRNLALRLAACADANEADQIRDELVLRIAKAQQPRRRRRWRRLSG